MTLNVVKLTAIEPEALGKGIEDVLTKMLERAKRGELSSIAVAYVGRAGNVGSAYSAAPNTALLIGSIANLQHRILSDWKE